MKFPTNPCQTNETPDLPVRTSLGQWEAMLLFQNPHAARRITGPRHPIAPRQGEISMDIDVLAQQHNSTNPRINSG